MSTSLDGCKYFIIPNKRQKPQKDNYPAITLVMQYSVTAINAMYVRSNKTCTNITTQSSSPTIVGM
jgi:hypothetical protein